MGLPGDWAHSLQVMKMCEAFAGQGLDVELIVPRRSAKALINEDPFVYYNVARIFKITRLFCVDLIPGGVGLFNFLLRTVSFLCAARLYLFFQSFDVLYTREQLAGLFFGRPVYELHSLPRRISWLHKINWRKTRVLVALTRFIKEQLVEQGFRAEKILTAGDAVSLEEFSINLSQGEARQQLALPPDKKIVLYTGSFFTHSWKGVDILLQAAALLPENYLVVFVGGNEKEISQVKKDYGQANLLFIGQKPHREIPLYLRAADILVLPNKRGDVNSEKYTSPLKLFEYLASGAAIVASRLPSITEALNEANAILVEPNDAAELAGGIKRAGENAPLAQNIARQALLDAKKYTWSERAKNIIDFIL